MNRWVLLLIAIVLYEWWFGVLVRLATRDLPAEDLARTFQFVVWAGFFVLQLWVILNVGGLLRRSFRSGATVIVISCLLTAWSLMAVNSWSLTLWPYVALLAGLFGATLLTVWAVCHRPWPRRGWTGYALLLTLIGLRSFVIAGESDVQTANGFELSLFASDHMLANPVACCVDHKNRLYVLETHTFDLQPLTYSPEELACRTWQDGKAIWEAERTGGPQGKIQSDRVLRIVDRNGDGRADDVSVFADGFDPYDGVAAGVIARGDTVWVGNAPHLWKMRDADDDGTAEHRQILHSGFGLRRKVLGHDLHGFTFGPDGKLYFSIGDRGLHVTSGDNVLASVPDSGAVLRCNADGSQLEVIATGLRNPQDLAFDDFGNLWTGDNNANLGDESRWTYIAEGGDYGWRIGYMANGQTSPYMQERIWDPQTEMPNRLPAVALIGVGPAGVAYYPGTGLPAEYAGHFFLCDFPGRVLTFSVRPKGAGFELNAPPEAIVHRLWPTDIVFGTDGAMYVLDWTGVNGYRLPGIGRIYRLQHRQARSQPIVLETQRLLAEGMDHRDPASLGELLGHADLRVRQAAQFALAEGEDAALHVLDQQAATDQPLMARVHAIWGLGQRLPGRIAEQSLQRLLQDETAEVRTQAARVLGDHRVAGAFDDLVLLLKDENLRVRYFAAMGLGNLGRTESVGPILEMVRENGDRDPFLRHAAVMALTRIEHWESVWAAAGDRDRAVRLTVLLTLRRWKRPQVAQFLGDRDPLLRVEAARAIYDEPIEAALPELARASLHAQDEAFLRRVLHANLRVGARECGERLVNLAVSSELPEALRGEALELLKVWDRPGPVDLLTGRWDPLPERPAGLASEALASRIDSLITTDSLTARLAALEAAVALNVRLPADTLIELFRNEKLKPERRAAALRMLAEHWPDRLWESLSLALESSSAVLRRCGVSLLPQSGRDDVPQRLMRIVVADSEEISTRQTAIMALGELSAQRAAPLIEDLLTRMERSALPEALHLEVGEVVQQHGLPHVVNRWEQLRKQFSGDDRLGPWLVALDGGDPKAGGRLFSGQQLQCVKCHQARDDLRAAGPNLAGIGRRRNRRYLLESIFDPNAFVVPEYRNLTLVLDDGRVVTGRLISRNQRTLELQQPDGARQRIAAKTIEDETEAGSGMPTGLADRLTLRELRDLIAYLAEL